MNSTILMTAKLAIMKKIIFLPCCFFMVMVLAQEKDYAIKAVPFTQVKLTDEFWLPRIKINRDVTIPASFERCEQTGRVKNFIQAALRKGKFCTKYPFDDTDIYKTIEGASYSLSLYPDAKLAAYLDTLIDIIGKAQEPDGYLYTARTINPDQVHEWSGKERWEKERELSHELYNAGHLYEAAVAHFIATKKRTLLNIALKNADLICSVFGPDKKHVAPGHEIIEMGLVKLYRVTGKLAYLQTAKIFIGERGHYTGYDTKSKDPWKNGAYWQDDIPVTQQEEAEGHAVRAGYLYSAIADVAALTGDDSLLKAIDRIWENMVSKKMYVQGGIGAIGSGERFGNNYELPNGTAYNETCAAIASVYWNFRMFQLHGDAKYFDVLEKTLYNGLISGIGLDGKSFFYTNAMQITHNFKHGDIEYARSGWFECSCCPTNLVRFIPSIPGYVYAQKNNQVFVNLFINGTGELKINNQAVQIEQQNHYPWDGGLFFYIKTPTALSFDLKIRVPGWSQNKAIPSTLYNYEKPVTQKVSIKVNDQVIEFPIENGYAIIHRNWKNGDKVEMVLPMEVQRVLANENVTDNIGKVALQRGPIIYCAEGIDNNGKADNLLIPSGTVFNTIFQKNLLAGVTVLSAEVPAIIVENEVNVSTVKQQFTAIPYYSWANRGKTEMMIWFPAHIKEVTLQSK